MHGAVRVAALTAAVIATLAVPAAALAPARERDQRAGAATRRPVAVGVREKEWSIAVYRKRPRARKIKLNVFNRGEDRHNLRIVGHGVDRKTADVKPGDNASLTVNVKPGYYRLTCTLRRHEQRGMRSGLVVRKPKKHRRR